MPHLQLMQFLFFTETSHLFSPDLHLLIWILHIGGFKLENRNLGKTQQQWPIKSEPEPPAQLLPLSASPEEGSTREAALAWTIGKCQLSKMRKAHLQNEKMRKTHLHWKWGNLTSKVEMVWCWGSTDLAQAAEGWRRSLSNFRLCFNREFSFWVCFNGEFNFLLYFNWEFIFLRYFNGEFRFWLYFEEEFILGHLKNNVCVNFRNMSLKYDCSLFSFNDGHTKYSMLAVNAAAVSLDEIQ